MTQLANIPSFSKPLVAHLAKLGLHTLQDLILHLPLRYLDETRLVAIRDLRLGDTAQVEGEVSHAAVSYKPRKALTIQLQDASGQLTLRFLHFYPSQVNALKAGVKLRVYGEVRQGFFGYEMVHPQYKTARADMPVNTELTPIYPTTAGLSQPALRKAIQFALAHADLAETLPSHIYANLQLPSFATSLESLHHPAASANLTALENHTTPAWQRLAYDELIAQQLSMRNHYAKRRRLQAPRIRQSEQLAPRLLQQLPFALTKAQQKVLHEISSDLTQAHPMQRLLQGDVGSGKTIVACLAALQAIEQGWQVALMVPTEILAEQHFQKFSAWLAPLQVRIAWLTGSQSKKEREMALSDIAQGKAPIAIGTHALFQEAVQFAKLGLAIIDEQHRFGVQQRLALRKKGQPEPHQLMMTATPIPRTLSMSYYADLDVSVIDELPPNRNPIVTKLIADERRDEVLLRVYEACRAGKQAYWVCPLIDESDLLTLQTATETAENLKASFSDLSIGLIHGRMKSGEKQTVMQDFSQGRIQLLVATTVIEVGVDVPNASLMIIEHAERMGLSQLHQLRGRVGRGQESSTCILLYQAKLSETARARLKVIYENSDGFAIAQADLDLRGPGELLGTRQSGLPMLKIADLTRDIDYLQSAKSVADSLLKTHPDAVAQHLRRWLPNAADLVTV